MSNDIGKKIYDLRKAQGLTLEEVGRAVGVGRSTVRKWENGMIANMRRDKIASLAAALHTTPAYLMGWKEEDFAVTVENILPMPNMRPIPLLGTIACGEPILADENLDGEVAAPEHVTADFALRCKGDSMINARIYDGDVVYIRQQDTVRDGEIAAVLIGDEATLKRVRLFPDHIVLEPENPQFRPLAFWGEEADAVRILGKAVAFTSAVR